MGSICSCFGFIRTKDEPQAYNTESHLLPHPSPPMVCADAENIIINGVVIVKSTSTESNSNSSESKVEAETCYLYASQDDEDVCPTCLEEYSFDNPRIETKCKHDFHLACIYEWMERSQTCPLCLKAMEFAEM